MVYWLPFLSVTHIRGNKSLIVSFNLLRSFYRNITGGNVALQVSIMFATLEKIAQTDPKYADIFLFENYAAFQNR